jgi:cytidine deaminase
MLTNEQRDQLVQTALHARRWAYAPYSHYSVGAALLTASGRVYDGVNVENAVFPDTICAERVAVFKAVSEGEREFLAVAVVTDNGGSPCGSCRQVLSEFSHDCQIFLADKDGRLTLETSLDVLLPDAFGAKDLTKGSASDR